MLVRVFYHSKRKVSKTEVATRKWTTAVAGLTMLFFWRDVEDIPHVGLWTRNVVEDSEWCLLGHFNRNTEDSTAESIIILCGGPSSRDFRGRRY